MEAIKGILAEYYWIFLIVGILVLITLIGFIASVKKKAKEEQAFSTEEQKPNDATEAPAPPQQTGVSVDLTPTASQTYVEPSLDGLASSATEVKLGFDTTAQPTSIFENNQPTLVIEDNATAQPVM